MLAVDYIAEWLVGRGVRHVFGVGGANIEDLFSAVQRRRPRIQAVLCKHEHAAGAAADAYARLSGELGVVMVTSGGATMNLVHALAEAHASEVPVLALVGEPPTDQQGRGAFQDSSGRDGTIDGRAVLAAVARRCIRVTELDALPQALADALAAAFGATPGPAVVLLAKDLQRAELQPREAPSPRLVSVEPDARAIQAAAALLPGGRAVVIAGPEVARRDAQEQLAALVDRLDADVAVTPDARDAFDNRDPRFLGVAGSMSSPAVVAALDEARASVIVGTRLPVLARMGLEPRLREVPMVSLGGAAPYVAPPRAVHVAGDVRECMRALTLALAPRPARPRARPEPALPRRTEPLRSPAALGAIGAWLCEGSTVLVDAGNTGAAAIHWVPAPVRGRWLVAMGMAGMGWSFGASIGAALATGRRGCVIAGDGAFFMHGLEIHTAVEHRLPVTYVVMNNAAHGMCLVRERLLLGENMGYNAFQPAHLGAGLRAMFPGVPAFDCRTLAELEAALARAAREPGPSVVVVELPEVEIPPFVAFAHATRAGITTVAREQGDTT